MIPVAFCFAGATVTLQAEHLFEAPECNAFSERRVLNEFPPSQAREVSFDRLSFFGFPNPLPLPFAVAA